MLCTGLHVHEFKMTPTKRRSFCKELKLKVTNNWYFENGENINQAANNFQIDRKQVRNWPNDEEKKGMPTYEKQKFPAIEKELYKKFLDKRKETCQALVA